MVADWSFRPLAATCPHSSTSWPSCEGWPSARKLQLAIFYSIALVAVVLCALSRFAAGAAPADSVQRLDLVDGTADDADERQLLVDLEGADFLHSAR